MTTTKGTDVSTPTVTITVAGSAVTAPAGDLPSEEDMVAGLHMLYVQAVKDETRVQFVVFPPAREALGAGSHSGDPLLLLKRTQERVGNRSKWFHSRIHDKAQVLQTELAGLEASGYVLGAPVAVPLERDDYVSAWAGNTPHKALRAVDRALRPLGFSVK